VIPMDTTNLRPLVTCRPTINFQLPSALGDQVHNLETFGLKAEPVLNQLPVPTPAPIPTPSAGSSSVGTRFWKSDLSSKCLTQTQLPVWIDPCSGKEDVDVGGGGGGRYDLSPVTAHPSSDGAGVGVGVGVGMPDFMGSGHTSIAGSEQSRNAHDPNHRYLVDNNNPNRRVGDGGDQLHPRARSKKIHPRPMYNQIHRGPSINIIQPPPHTYTPNGLYPSPITTSSSNSSLFRQSDPRLPGVNQLFDDHPLTFPPSLAHSGHGHGHGHGIALSAPPSTIFPNHLRSQDRYLQQHPSYTPNHTQSTHLHPPPFPTLDHLRSASTSQYSYNHDRDYDPDMMDLDAESGLDRQEMDLSQSPSLISVNDSVDQHQDQDDYEMDISRRSSITGSSESEEAEEEEEEEEEGDEEVLGEYKPNYKGKRKSKSKGNGKGKVPVLTKIINPPQKVKSVPNAAITNRPRLNDDNNGVGNGSIRVPSATEGSNMGHQTKIPKGRGKFNGGYTFIYEDGVAYTDDAELKQTREVCLLICHISFFFLLHLPLSVCRSHYHWLVSEAGHFRPIGL